MFYDTKNSGSEEGLVKGNLLEISAKHQDYSMKRSVSVYDTKFLISSWVFQK